MSKTDFRTYFDSHRLMLFSGATGTELMKAGGDTPGAVNNITMPEMVLGIQRGYVDEGASIILSNTFSINKIYAGAHLKDYDYIRLNAEGCRIAKDAAGGKALVFGNLGPCGGLLEPFGNLKADEVYEAFREQAEILVKGGCEGLSIQTFFSLEEIKLCVKACRSVTDLPIIADMVFNDTGATLMGETPLQCYEALLPLGIDAFGHNCGEINCYRLGDILEPVTAVAEIPIIALPNAGKPRQEGEKTYYDMTPEQFREGIEYLIKKGVRIIGGCCGVNRYHIRAVADLIY